MKMGGDELLNLEPSSGEERTSSPSEKRSHRAPDLINDNNKNTEIQKCNMGVLFTDTELVFLYLRIFVDVSCAFTFYLSLVCICISFGSH